MSDPIAEKQVEEAQAAAEAATTPSTFNFAEAILDRSYPEFEVPIYLDEKSVQRMLDLDEEIDARETHAAQRGASIANSKGYDKLVKERDALRKTLRAAEFKVSIRGISPESAIKLENQAFEKFPQEYVENQNPITGQPIKTPVDNEDRDELITMLYRQAHLVSITSPDGAVDDDFADIEKVRVMFARMPFVARAKIDQSIQKATIAVDFYRELTDEVF